MEISLEKHRGVSLETCLSKTDRGPERRVGEVHTAPFVASLRKLRWRHARVPRPKTRFVKERVSAECGLGEFHQGWVGNVVTCISTNVKVGTREDCLPTKDGLIEGGSIPKVTRFEDRPPTEFRRVKRCVAMEHATIEPYTAGFYRREEETALEPALIEHNWLAVHGTSKLCRR